MNDSDQVGTMETVSDELLAEILAGLEGVTPGPYHTVYSRDGTGDVGIKADGVLNVVAECFGAMRHKTEHSPEAMHNAEHFARLDPETVRSILSELVASRLAKQASGTVTMADKDAWQSAAELRSCSRNGGEWDFHVITDAADLIDAQQTELRELRYLVGEVEQGDKIRDEEIGTWRRTAERCKSEAEVCEAALAFYANPKNYQPVGHPQIDADTKPILHDGGYQARAALPAPPSVLGEPK